MNNAHETTPREISEAILGLCAELVPDPHPVYLEFEPLVDADVNDCFQVVAEQVDEEGGSICHGWHIWEWPFVFVEAEFHAVWKDPNGKLHEITPNQLQLTRVLFLPDPVRVYEGKQIKNARRPLSSYPDVAEFIQASDARYEFMNRGERATQHGEIQIEGSEAREYASILIRLNESYQSILARVGTLERNGPCPCSSGKKFKKCHGR